MAEVLVRWSVAMLLLIVLSGLEKETALNGAESNRSNFQPEETTAGEKEEEQTGADSPEDLVRMFLTGLVTGDEDKVALCFNQSTDLGQGAAESYRLLARLYGTVESAKRAARQKFGHPGHEIVQEELDVNLDIRSTRQIESWINEQVEVAYFQPDEAVAVGPAANGSKNWRLKKCGGRWYMSVTREEVLGVGIFAGLLQTTVTEPFDRVPQLLEESATPAEFRSRLQAAKAEAREGIVKPVDPASS